MIEQMTESEKRLLLLKNCGLLGPGQGNSWKGPPMTTTEQAKCPGCGAPVSVEGSRVNNRLQWACESYEIKKEFCQSWSCMASQLRASQALSAELLAACKTARKVLIAAGPYVSANGASAAISDAIYRIDDVIAKPTPRPDRRGEEHGLQMDIRRP